MQIIIREKEIWKDITYKNAKPVYIISTYGIVKNKYTGNIMHQRKDTDGYLRVELKTIDGKRLTCRVHILVADTFLEKPLIILGDDIIVNHKNGVKHDPNVANLEWLTHSENLKHAFREGLASNKGECNSQSKYSENLIRYICKQIVKGYKNKEIIEKVKNKYGIELHKYYPKHIRNKVTWTHVSDEYFIYNKNKEIIILCK